MTKIAPQSRRHVCPPAGAFIPNIMSRPIPSGYNVLSVDLDDPRWGAIRELLAPAVPIGARGTWVSIPTKLHFMTRWDPE